MYRRYVKRALDVVLAGAALLLLSPVMALIVAAVKLEGGGRVLFRQRRVGRDGEPFTLLKFRSMPENTGDVPSDRAQTLQVTRVGRIIRRTNADELPQLVNILRGDMSVVGPRPALPLQEELIAQRRANGSIACVPGLTGLAQIKAHDGMTVAAKASWDGEYARRITFARDLSIILGTFRYLTKPPPTY